MNFAKKFTDFEIQMAVGNHNTKLGCHICVLIIVACMLSNHEFAVGRQIVTAKNIELVKHKGTVKTIQSEDGDVIDCVDIYKQPAFDHPLIKNHTIQLKPSSYPSGIKLLNSQAKITQSWLKNGPCPEGTVPIRRTQLNHSFANALANPHEYAQVSMTGNTYYGAHASINVWNPTTENGEFSAAQIWVLAGSDEDLNSIEAGVMVNPTMNHDNQTRFFVHWTKDNYQNTGCYDLHCPGFVQTSKKFALGSPIKPVSSYNASQYDIAITIYKDKQSENWMLQVQDEVMGYWPSSIFSTLAGSATALSWGGEIINTNSEGHHTSTQMGSGQFPSEGYGKASYFRNLAWVDNANNQRNAADLQPLVTNPSCYDLHLEENTSNDYGTHFYYGGPGYSDKCP